MGPEIIPEAIKVLDLISAHSDVKFIYETALMGGCSIDKHGVALTDDVLNLAKKSDAVLFGSVGGPKWYANTPTTSLIGLNTNVLKGSRQDPTRTRHPNPPQRTQCLRKPSSL